MISPDKLNQKQVSKMLVEKHQRFLDSYAEKFNILQKLNVLNEKQEQLKYWIDSLSNNEGNPSYQKYLNEKKFTDIEVARLKKEMEKFQSDGTASRNRSPSWLEQQITLHKKATDYWDCKYKDFSATRRKPDERKGSERKDKRPKARDRQKK